MVWVRGGVPGRAVWSRAGKTVRLFGIAGGRRVICFIIDMNHRERRDSALGC